MMGTFSTLIISKIILKQFIFVSEGPFTTTVFPFPTKKIIIKKYSIFRFSYFPSL